MSFHFALLCYILMAFYNRVPHTHIYIYHTYIFTYAVTRTLFSLFFDPTPLAAHNQHCAVNWQSVSQLTKAFLSGLPSLHEHVRTCLGSNCNKLPASSSFSCLIDAVTSLRRVSPTSVPCCLISLICMSLLQVRMICSHMHNHTYISDFL